MDRFKNYIHDHKHELEEEFREERVWEQISQNLSPIQKKSVRQMRGYWVAATIIATVLIAVYATYILYRSESNDAVTIVKTANTNIMNLEGVFPAEVDSSALLQSLQKDTEQNRIESKKPVLAKMVNRKVKAPVTGDQDIHTDESFDVDKNLNHYRSLEVDEESSKGRNLWKSSGLDPGLSTDSNLDHKIRAIQSIQVYADRPDYFNLFIDQYHKIIAYEQKLKGELGENKEEFNTIFSLLCQQKYFLLSQLQFEIEKMNAQIMQQPYFNADKHYFISI